MLVHKMRKKRKSKNKQQVFVLIQRLIASCDFSSTCLLSIWQRANISRVLTESIWVPLRKTTTLLERPQTRQQWQKLSQMSKKCIFRRGHSERYDPSATSIGGSVVPWHFQVAPMFETYAQIVRWQISMSQASRQNYCLSTTRPTTILQMKICQSNCLSCQHSGVLDPVCVWQGVRPGPCFDEAGCLEPLKVSGVCLRCNYEYCCHCRLQHFGRSEQSLHCATFEMYRASESVLPMKETCA